MYPTEPLKTDIGTLAWLSGRWIGEDGDDRIEEFWSEPHAGMMLGMFRAHRSGEPRFYELFAVEPEDGWLVLRIKHFRPGLVGWEERDQAVTLDLTVSGDGRAVFAKRGEAEWMLYRHDAGSGELVITFEAPGREPDPGDAFRFFRG